MADVTMQTMKLGMTFKEFVSLLNTNFSTIEQAIEDTGDITTLIQQHNTAEDAHTELLAGMITNIQLSESKDGVFTITKKDGSSYTIDTMLEKVVANFDYNEETGNLVLTLDDGTTKEVSLARFIDTYIGTQEGDSGVQVRVTIDSATKKISATIENGVITEAMLGTELAAKINNKIDKVEGKGLSTNDYDDAAVAKLAGIAENANNYVLPTAGDALGGVKNGGNIVIGADGTMNAGSRVTFTDSDERWSDAVDGIYTLTVATTAIPLKVLKLVEGGVYEEVVAQPDITSTGFKVESNSKFAGIVICM